MITRDTPGVLRVIMGSPAAVSTGIALWVADGVRAAQARGRA
jgi:hypothetical protein